MSDSIIPPLPEIPGVEIRHVPDFPGYAVSNTGIVFSCHRNGRLKGFGKKWYSLKPGIVSSGMHQVVLYVANAKFQRKVHAMVLETFIGPKPHGQQCCHWDGNPINNNLSNLRWDTPKQNMADRRRHKRYCGEKVWLSKLTEDQVKEIRSIRLSGISQTRIAQMFGVSQNTISGIIRRKIWIHI
jgi:hypothetical protein